MPASSSSFSQKQLRVTFTLTNNNAVFPGSPPGQPSNVLQLTGLRMSANIKAAGGPSFAEATLKVFGMSQADMNALSVQVVSGGKTGILPNTMLIEANSGNGWTAAYAGNINTAGADYTAAPDVCLLCTSTGQSYLLANPATPTSFPGPTDVGDMVSVIVTKMGYGYINNGVNVTLPHGGYYAGALADQLRKVCQAANIDFVISPNGNTVTISPKGQGDATTPWVLTPASGLVGYPQALGNGFISGRSFYNPQFHIKSNITIRGSDVVIDPNVPNTLNNIADGDWVIQTLTNTLESVTPNGAWFSDFTAYPPGTTNVQT